MRPEKGKRHPVGRRPPDKPHPQPPAKPGEQKEHMDDTKQSDETKQSAGGGKQPEKTPEEKMAEALDKSLKAHIGTIQLDPSELKAVATDLVAAQKEQGDGEGQSKGQSGSDQ